MKSLGRKQRITNDSWLEAIEHIEELVPEPELERLAGKTVENIRAVAIGKKAAFCWSGGKDSLVLEQLCYAAGIRECVLVISDLEYRSFLQWVTDHMPELLTVIDTHQDIDWLSRHPEMLFPQDSGTAAKWFHIVQHRGQAEYYRRYNLDMMLLGRRKADGNYCGKNSNIYTNSQGVTRFSPMADWSHEDVLAFLKYRGIGLPPFYGWKNGYYCGTHPWPARQWTGSIENGWKEVHDIDPTIVEEASKVIPSAKAFLESGVI